MGNYGTGTLHITDGGMVSSGIATIGFKSGAVRRGDIRRPSSVSTTHTRHW